MVKYNVKSILRKYRFCVLGCVYTGAIIAILVLFLTDNSFLFLLAAFLFMIFSKIIRVYFYNKHISSILFKELNPRKYNAVFEVGKMVSNHLFEKIYFSYYTGDYQLVINICSAKLNDSKQKKYKYMYMLYLARSYFELGDYENLHVIYEVFRTNTEADVKCEKLRNKYIYFNFIGLYLKGEFAECKALYERMLSNEKSHNSKTHKILDIQTKFTYAISCYKCKDIENATNLFKYIVTEAPQLNFAVISQKYLNAIEADIEYQPEYATVYVDENYVLPRPRKSIRVRKIIAFILIEICLLSLYFSNILVPDKPVHFKGLDYSTMRSDIEELYGEPDEIKEFISPEGEFYDIYEAKFLGIKGKLEFRYFDGGDNLFVAQFIIDSNDFETCEEYEYAISKTYNYFDRVLSGYRKRDMSDESGISISWSRNSDMYAYSMYDTQITDTDFSSDLREGMVFQFNKYLSEE